MQVNQEMLTDNEEEDDNYDEICAVWTPRPLSEIGRQIFNNMGNFIKPHF